VLAEAKKQLKKNTAWRKPILMKPHIEITFVFEERMAIFDQICKTRAQQVTRTNTDKER